MTDDKTIVEMYKEVHSLSKIAKKLGLCDEQVRRVLIRNNVQLKKRSKPKKYSHIPKEIIIKEYKNSNLSQLELSKKLGCSPAWVNRCLKESGENYEIRDGNQVHKKITKEELIEDSKRMTTLEIAKKHNMGLYTITDRQIKEGITPNYTGICHDKRIARAKVRGVKYEKGITLDKVIKRDKGICQICGKPVDYDSRSENGKGMGKLYPTIDHIIPLSKGGAHTWENVQLAHLMCNSLKGDYEEEEKKGR